MSRKNIFELMEREYNLKDEIENIEKLIRQQRTPFVNGLEHYVNTATNLFLNWEYRDTYISSNDFRKANGISRDHFSTLENVPLSKALMYFELIMNLSFLIVKKDKHFHHYSQHNRSALDAIMLAPVTNIRRVIDAFNYTEQFIDEKEVKLILVEKNPSATAVAEIIEDDKRSLDIIRYNHHALKGDLDEKRKILSQLYKEFEKIRKDIKDVVKINSSYPLDSELGRLFQSTDIRHGGTRDIVYDNFMALPASEKEEWYDRIYDMFLTAMLTKNYVDMKDDLDAIKSDGQV